MVCRLNFEFLLLCVLSIRLLRRMVLSAEELEEVCVETDSILVYIGAIRFLPILLEEERKARISVESLGTEVGHLRPGNVPRSHIGHYVLLNRRTRKGWILLKCCRMLLTVLFSDHS